MFLFFRKEVYEVVMLKKISLQNFTVFTSEELHFSKQLNVVVGENGAGKSHLLKIAYSTLATSAAEGRRLRYEQPVKTALQIAIADKLVGVFRPESLGRLARRRQGRERCDVGLSFFDENLDLSFGFATNSKSEVSIDTMPKKWISDAPAFFPTRELLTIFPNFISVYEGHYLEFEETWRDICILLGAPLQKGPKESRIKTLLEPLEKAMEGSIDLDKNGRFYLVTTRGRMEMPLVAEGLRKLGMLSRLIATGTLLDRGFLFWDEPEANLNPRLIKYVAKTILDLGKCGIQVFIATHSLFLLRELDILCGGNDYKSMEARYFGLQKNDDGVSVMQGNNVDDIGDIAALDEELSQSDRFLD
ncbi:MAG TPA: AAA family ATPase [Nitratidesulfovibrio sp.]|nr:AAA family ATPase [Nitratidesulfovibrio sp.]